jgi:hypothetical protein
MDGGKNGSIDRWTGRLMEVWMEERMNGGMNRWTG